MGKETTQDRACIGTAVQEGLEQPQKGTVMRGRELLCKNLPACPKGITEANKGKRTRETPGGGLPAARNTVGLKSPGPETQFLKHQTPRKISREASRTKALSIADRSRICFASYEQINSVDECARGLGNELHGRLLKEKIIAGHIFRGEEIKTCSNGKRTSSSSDQHFSLSFSLRS